jgi:hypothetical protein
MPEQGTSKIGDRLRSWIKPNKDSKNTPIRITPQVQENPASESEPPVASTNPPAAITNQEFLIPGFNPNDSPDPESDSNAALKGREKVRRFIRNPKGAIQQATDLKQDIPDDDNSIEKKRAPQRVSTALGALLLLTVGCVCVGGVGFVAPKGSELFYTFIKGKVEEGSGLESLRKYPGVNELVQQNVAIKVTEADGVSLDEYAKNIRIRNEIIEGSKFNKSYGAEADFLVLNSSPTFAARSMYDKTTSSMKYIDSLLDGKYYKDGKARTSFSLGNLDDMNKDDREYVKSILSGTVNQVVVVAFLTDPSKLPNDNIIAAFVNPFRRAYTTYNNRENYPVVVGARLDISNDRRRYQIIDSDMVPVDEKERTKDYEGLKSVIPLLEIFAGGKYIPGAVVGK